MVERINSLDNIFGSLSDPTRRDILKRVSKKTLSVGEIAKHYKLTFAGIAKHLQVLQDAGLVRKTKQGKEQIVAMNPKALAAANNYLENFEGLWEKRLDNLDKFLMTNK